jgi:hypothetical protein
MTLVSKLKRKMESHRWISASFHVTSLVRW